MIIWQGICRDVKARPEQQTMLGGNRAVLFVFGNYSLYIYNYQYVFICEQLWLVGWLVFLTVKFHAATEGLDNMAFVSNIVSIVTYFYGYMNFSLTKSASTLTNFIGTAFLLALVGGFISDTYLSRFKTCVLFGFIEFLVCSFFHSSLLHTLINYHCLTKN